MAIVEREIRDAVAVLTLNRPAKLNALSYAVNDALLANLDCIEADAGLGAVVLTGAGTRAFSAGADIPEFRASLEQGTEIALQAFVRRGQAVTARIETFPKPVIAAVNGLAFGGGCEITEAAHLAIASQAATFAKPEIAIGIPPTFGGTQRLPRLAGRKRALALLLTGERFDAKCAREIGVVNEVVADGQALDAALDMAARILRHPPATVAAILRAVSRGLDQTIGEGLATEAEQFAWVAETDATRAALDAWIAPRAARASA